MPRHQIDGSPAWAYLRARQLEGSLPRDRGAQIISAQRVAFGWGSIRDEDWPDARLNGPEPPHLEQVAKANRSSLYYRAGGLLDVKQSLAGNVPVLAAFPVTPHWFYVADGSIERLDGEPIATHSVVLAGYSDRDQKVRFINSWGQSWGNNGTGTLSYDFVVQHMVEAWSAEFRPQLKPDARQQMVVTWGRETPIGLMHAIEIVDAPRDDRKAWALVRQHEEDLWLEDLFVKPNARNRGLGSELAREVLRLEKRVSMSLAGANISAIDATLNLPAVDRIAKRLRLQLRPSEDPWVPYVACRLSERDGRR